VPAGEVLDQAHQVAVGFRGVDDDRRDHRLVEDLIGLEPALTADQIVARTVVVGAADGHGDRPLQSECGDVVDDLGEGLLAAAARVEHADPMHRDRPDGRRSRRGDPRR